MFSRKFWVVGVLVGLAGCSGASDKLKAARPKTVTAQGIVTRKGQPLSRVLVMCRPVGGQHGCSGLSDGGGRFELMAFNPDPGAVPGKYEVSLQTTVQAVEEPPEDVVLPKGQKPPPVPTPELPTKYASYETAKLILEIPAYGSRELKIDLLD